MTTIFRDTLEATIPGVMQRCPVKNDFGAINKTVDNVEMNKFPTFMLPTNENIIQITFYKEESNEYLFQYKLYFFIKRV